MIHDGQWSLTPLFRIALLLNTCFNIIYYPLIKLQTKKKFTWMEWQEIDVVTNNFNLVKTKHRNFNPVFFFVHCNLSLHLSTPSALAYSSCILDDFARRRHHLKQQWCLSMQVFFLVHPSHKQGDLVSPNLVLGITYLGVPKLFLLTLFK